MLAKPDTPLVRMFQGLSCLVDKCKYPPTALITTMCQEGHLRHGPICNKHRCEERLNCAACQKKDKKSTLFGEPLPPKPDFVITGPPMGKRRPNMARPTTLHKLHCSEEPRAGALTEWSRWKVPETEIEFTDNKAIWDKTFTLRLCRKCNPRPMHGPLLAYAS
jgi:hypothetical protein